MSEEVEMFPKTIEEYINFYMFTDEEEIYTNGLELIPVLKVARGIEHYFNELQQENQQLKEKIKTYEDPEDMTLMYMWCNEKAKDKINQLKEVIEEVREYTNNKLFDDYTYCSYEDVKQNINEILDKAKDVK